MDYKTEIPTFTELKILEELRRNKSSTEVILNDSEKLDYIIELLTKQNNKWKPVIEHLEQKGRTPSLMLEFFTDLDKILDGLNNK